MIVRPLSCLGGGRAREGPDGEVSLALGKPPLRPQDSFKGSTNVGNVTHVGRKAQRPRLCAGEAEMTSPTWFTARGRPVGAAQGIKLWPLQRNLP